MSETSVIPIDERSEKILEDVHPLESLDVTLAEARGCLVADDVRTTQPFPHFSSCSTAGFAVRAADATQGARLLLVGGVSARAADAAADLAAADVDTDAEEPATDEPAADAEASDVDDPSADAEDSATDTDDVATEGSDPDAGKSRRFRRSRKSRKARKADKSSPDVDASAVAEDSDTDTDTDTDTDGTDATADEPAADAGKADSTADEPAADADKSRRFRRSWRANRAREADKSSADTGGPEAIDAGQAGEVHVGAPLPAGADAVIPFDAVKIDGDHVVVVSTVERGQGVSMEGSIAAEGTLLIPGHTLIDARKVGLLAAIGLPRVTVLPRPRIVIVSVGDDLVSDAADMGPTHEHDATGALLASAAATAGAVPYRVNPIADVPELVAESLDDQLIRADVIVVCGPISSPSDTIRSVLERIGDVSYDDGTTNLGVFGTGFLGDEGTHIVSLPREPVAAYLLFRTLVDPIIAGMLGSRFPELSSISLGADVPLSPDRTQFVLASVDDWGRAQPATNMSPTLVDLQEADALIRLLPGSGSRRQGTDVSVLMLANGSEPT